MKLWIKLDLSIILYSQYNLPLQKSNSIYAKIKGVWAARVGNVSSKKYYKYKYSVQYKLSNINFMMKFMGLECKENLVRTFGGRKS